MITVLRVCEVLLCKEMYHAPVWITLMSYCLIKCITRISIDGLILLDHYNEADTSL